MNIERELRKPSNWQDFERICCEIAKVVWQDPYAKRNGRQGQKQDGVDIYGHENNSPEISDIQCKRYDKISNSIIDDEINNATGFKPALKHLIIATTADRDVKIEEYVRQKDVENRKNNLFGVSILEWEDIVDILEQNPPLLNLYENIIGSGFIKAIEVSFSSGDAETIIHPHFIEKVFIAKDSYSKKVSINIPSVSYPLHPFAQNFDLVTGEINHSYVPLGIQIRNIGLVEIKPLSLILDFPKEVSIDSKNETHHLDLQYLIPTQTFIDKKANNVSFNCDRLLPGRAAVLSEIFVKPDPSVKEFGIDWDFSSSDFRKQGKLKVYVNPEITQKSVISEKFPLPNNVIVDDIEDITNNKRKSR